MNYADPKLQARQTQIVEVLETVCESVELSTSQFALAEQRYEGVGACLASSDDPMLRAINIYLQGSTALRTTREAYWRQRARRRPCRPRARPQRSDLAGRPESPSATASAPTATTRPS
jgi:hypothetical protein